MVYTLVMSHTLVNVYTLVMTHTLVIVYTLVMTHTLVIVSTLVIGNINNSQHSPLDDYSQRICLVKTLPRKNPVR